MITDPRVTARELADHYHRAVNLPIPGTCGNCHQPVTYAVTRRQPPGVGVMLEPEATITPNIQGRWIIRDGYATRNTNPLIPRHKPHTCQLRKSGRAA